MTRTTSVAPESGAPKGREWRTRWTPRQRRKNDAIVVLVRLALAFARALPRRAITVTCSLLAVVAWIVFPRTRALARENLTRAGLRAPTTFRVHRELAAMLADTVDLLDLRRPAALSWTIGARERLARLHAEQRGVVLITAHLGPWERLAATLVESGFALTTPVRASYDPRLDAILMDPLRRGRGVNAVDRDGVGTPRALLRALRDGGVAGFLVDLNTRVASAEVPFFGRLAWTPTAPARLALRTGAPVVAVFATREGIVVEELRAVSPPARGSEAVLRDQVHELTCVMTAAVERAVRREPERWIWLHDRWGARRVPTRERARDKTQEPAGITDGLVHEA